MNIKYYNILSVCANWEETSRYKNYQNWNKLYG